MPECEHEVVPLDDDPTMGRCTKCGDDTFPLVDPEGPDVPAEYVRALLLRPVLERLCDDLREAVSALHGVVITSVSYVLGHESVATTHDYCTRIGASHAIDDVRAVLDAEGG